jgi:ABC-type uncharacterized transport system ATPase subunit
LSKKSTIIEDLRIRVPPLRAAGLIAANSTMNTITLQPIINLFVLRISPSGSVSYDTDTMVVFAVSMVH